MKKAILFDLDGTLTDTLASIAEAGNAMLALRGYPAQPIDAYRYFAGDGAKALVLRALCAAGEANPQCVLEEALSQYMEIFDRCCTHGVQPFDGIVLLLKQLHSLHIQTAVLSNKPHPMTVKVVEQIFGKECFSLIQGQTQQIPPKPDPSGVQLVLKQLHLDAEDCFYVGDSDVDMETAHRAGMESIGVLWGFRGEDELRKHHADHIVSQPLQILELL